MERVLLKWKIAQFEFVWYTKEAKKFTTKE
jgi:hypothetical protein